MLIDILPLLLETEMVGMSGFSLFGIIWNLLDVSVILILMSAASLKLMFFAEKVPPTLPRKVLSVLFIASAVFLADIAKAFGMRVLVHNRSAIRDDSVTQVPFDTLLRESDAVTLHCPLNADSEKLMNTEAFAKMKQGAILINTARGPIVDEEALRDALLSGKLLAAGIDVLCQEPMDADCPLFGIENCYITPHVAWAGLETRQRLLEVVAANIRAFLEGHPIHVVS